METGVQNNQHLVKLLRDQGWSVEPQRSVQNGWAAKPPDSKEIKFWHGSLFDHGTQDNLIAQLRTLGFETPVDRQRNGRAAVPETGTATVDTPVEAPPAPKEPEKPKDVVYLNKSQGLVWQAVKQSRPKGTTRPELATKLGLDPGQVSVHMRALTQSRLVRTTGATVSLRYYPTSLDVLVDISASNQPRNKSVGKGDRVVDRPGTQVPNVGSGEIDTAALTAPTKQAGDSNGHSRRSGPVKVRHQRPQSMTVRVAEIFKNIDKGLAMLSEGVALLHEELEPLASAHDDAVTRLKKVEDQMDRLIGAVTN